MSANQLIHPTQHRYPGATLSQDDWPGKSRQHGCIKCRYWGGVGHTLSELLSLARKEQELPDEQPVKPSRRTCGYWSARSQAYCGNSKKVAMFGGIGARCPQHDPDVTTAAFKAATSPIALAV